MSLPHGVQMPPKRKRGRPTKQTAIHLNPQQTNQLQNLLKSGQNQDTGIGENAADDMAQQQQTDELPPPNEVSEQQPEYKPARDRAPRRTGTGRKASNDAQIIEALTGYYGMAGILLYRANAYDGEVVLASAEKCAASIVAVAHRHKEVYATLQILTKNNDYVTLVMAHTALAIAIAANHNLVPAAWPAAFGMPLPPAAQAQQGPTPEQMLAYERAQQQQQAYDAYQQAQPAQQPPPEYRPGVAEGAQAPTVQYDASTFETIRQQAVQEALRQQQLADQQRLMELAQSEGAELVTPAPLQNPAIAYVPRR